MLQVFCWIVVILCYVGLFRLLANQESDEP